MSVSPAWPDNGPRNDKPRVIVIDQNRLRQAGLMHLLEAWADVVGLALTAVPPDIPLKKAKISIHCKMVILSLGSASVEHPQQRAWIEHIRAFVPEAALVVLSDREEPEEVCAAFQEGAAGFMPTSIDPSVAFQALSFIKGGGTFFPPSALLHNRHAEKGYRSRGNQVIGGLDYISQLTTKQKEVFSLLRQGQTNKTIARRLGMSDATVKVHVRSIMRKFGVANRTQLAIAAINGSNGTIEANAEERDEWDHVDTANVTRLAVTIK